MIEDFKKRKEQLAKQFSDLDDAIQKYVSNKVGEICKAYKLNFKSGMGVWTAVTEIYVEYPDSPEINGLEIVELSDYFDGIIEDNGYNRILRQPTVKDMTRKLFADHRVIDPSERLRLVKAWREFKELIDDLRELRESPLENFFVRHLENTEDFNYGEM